jgi:hypothetical protein
MQLKEQVERCCECGCLNPRNGAMATTIKLVEVARDGHWSSRSISILAALAVDAGLIWLLFFRAAYNPTPSCSRRFVVSIRDYGHLCHGRHEPGATGLANSTSETAARPGLDRYGQPRCQADWSRRRRPNVGSRGGRRRCGHGSFRQVLLQKSPPRAVRLGGERDCEPFFATRSGGSGGCDALTPTQPECYTTLT